MTDSGVPGVPDRAEGEDPAVGGHLPPADVTSPPTGLATPRGRHARRSGRRRRLWQVLAGVVALTCLAAVALAWIGVRGLRASDHLRSAGRMFHELQVQVERGDVGGARTTLTALQKETRAARAETDDLGWRLGAGVPRAGADLAAVRTVAVAVDDLARQGLPSLIEAAGAIDLGTLAPKNGRIDLAALQRTAPRVAEAAAAVRLARDRVDAISTDHLLSQTKAGVAELRSGLERAGRVTELAQRASVLVPAMLGGSRPRTYLLMFQNLAEVRATGGMPGAFLVVGANQGAMQVIDQGTAAELGEFQTPVLPVDPAARALYTDRVGAIAADVNLTPHYPTAAALVREMYRRRSGRTVDAVFATDPVALSYLLTVTGPIAMPIGEPLTTDNAVRKLLSEVYATMTSARQDHYFAAAARGVFEALTGQPRDMAGLIRQLSRAAGERRILMWSADPREQQLISGTTMDGELPITDRTTPTVGVFLNDGTGAKLDYYLRYTADLRDVSCRPDGSRELKLRVTLGSTAPRSGLTRDVTGLALAGEPYTIRTNVSIFSPTGGTVMDARLDGAQAPLLTGVERRRSVAILTVDLKPGATRTIEMSLLTGIPPAGAGPTLRPRLWTTPGVTPWGQNIQSADICAIRR